MHTTVTVNLGERRYPIHVGTGIAGAVATYLDAVLPGRRVLVVTDNRVGPLYAGAMVEALEAGGYHTTVACVPAGEGSKTLRWASFLIDELVGAGADRRTIVAALGGGVVGDLAGLAAAIFARGIPFIQIPTTLLAMVDASVGGKVAVDHPRAKNMIGAFHQPSLVLCDLAQLATLPDREYRAGLAEVVKYGVILDADFFAQLEASAEDVNRRQPALLQWLVAHCCRLKAGVVEQDERELTGQRAVLNYGHTFAHAFETAVGYSGLLHGEAVAMGMMCAARLAERLGLVGGELFQRQEALWTRLGLPTRIPRELLAAPLLETMRRDKKASGGRLRFVLPRRLGEVAVVGDVEEALVVEVLQACSA